MTVAEPLTLGRGLRAAARRQPRKVALRFGSQTISYAALVERAARTASMLRTDWRIGPGDRIALISANRPEFIEVLVGGSDLGAAVAMVNPRVGEREAAAILNDCEPRLVVADPRSAGLLTGWRGPLLVLGTEYEQRLARVEGGIEDVAAEMDPFALHYTSGTTGLPKGVPISHRSRVLSFFGMASEYGCYGPDDHFLALAPLCHGAGLTFALAPLYMGGTCTLLDRFDPEEVLAILHAQTITGVFFVPTHFNRIFDLPASTLDRLRGHRLTAMISNAAPLLQAAKERVTDYFGKDLLYECYGATESGIITNLRPAFQLEKRNCVGTPFVATEVELRDEAGDPVPDGAVGELFSRSPYLFDGYWRRPEETAEAIVDGWVTVGDLARRDEDGCYYIVDRKKDMIITGGINVYPREIENVIDQVPGVAEVAVIGRADPDWGEAVHAAIVRARGAVVDEGGIMAACNAALAGYKRPKTIEFVDALPRNTAGKVVKRDLR
ncbi:class I adenylate-forming enzyme family protein [Sphingomonas bacterium]|uniref:class I adenylate-forming enzyme family protein n=1 Tax=Sphingomonas bacterium TaxID=1895847 RepID=UPI001576E991|nr:AMP-binding protein [Sphingomonas bacterium]